MKLGDERLDKLISLLDQLLEGLVQLIFVKQVNALIPLRLQLSDLAGLCCDFATLRRNDLLQIDYILWRALAFELGDEVLQLGHPLHESLRVKNRALEGVICDRVFLGQAEEFELFP